MDKNKLLKQAAEKKKEINTFDLKDLKEEMKKDGINRLSELTGSINLVKKEESIKLD